MENSETKEQGLLKRATHRVRDFDFSGPHSSVSLVSVDQGGPANQRPGVRMIKARDKDSPALIQESLLEAVMKASNKDCLSFLKDLNQDQISELLNIQEAAKSSKSNQEKEEVMSDNKEKQAPEAASKSAKEQSDVEKALLAMQEQLSAQKAASDAIAVENQELKKSLEAMKAEKARAESFAREELLKEVLGEHADKVSKAVIDLPEEAFQAVLGGYKAQKAVLASADPFSEVGVSSAQKSAEDVKESALARAIKAKHAAATSK